MTGEVEGDRVAERQLPGERLAGWVPLVLSVLGLVGALAAAGLAVEAVADRNDEIAISASASTTVPADDGENRSGPAGSTTIPAPTTTTIPSTTTPPPDSSVEDTTAEPADCPPLFTVRFALASSSPLDDHALEIIELTTWMTDHPDAQLLLDGHADAGGTEEANLRLSFRRAEAVAELLVDAGIDPEQVQARGFGEYQPIVGAPPDSEANRRVTMQVPGRETCPTDDPGDDPPGDEETDR